MVEVAVDKAPGSQNMYTRVMDIVGRRGDHYMLTRLCSVVNGDRDAVEARYHRLENRYSHYISEKHTSAQQKEAARTDVYKNAIWELIEEYRPAIVQEK